MWQHAFKDELQKRAYFTVTPFNVRTKEEIESGTGYAKEYGNRMLSSILGGVTGGLAGGAVGALLGGSAIGPLATLGAIAGGVTSDYRALKKTEEAAHVRPQGVGPYVFRTAGASLGSAVLPVVGGPGADYLVSRHGVEYTKS
tara:strand:- start:305 stop:733 length:429 start_codon:yes stop_codon:yes gene_type:complete